MELCNYKTNQTDNNKNSRKKCNKNMIIIIVVRPNFPFLPNISDPSNTSNSLQHF